MLGCSPGVKSRALVLFAWGSRSRTITFTPRSARQAPRFTEVVVFPTPPFWLAMAMVFMGIGGWKERGRESCPILRHGKGKIRSIPRNFCHAERSPRFDSRLAFAVRL